jgi:hypothetical protein
MQGINLRAAPIFASILITSCLAASVEAKEVIKDKSPDGKVRRNSKKLTARSLKRTKRNSGKNWMTKPRKSRTRKLVLGCRQDRHGAISLMCAMIPTIGCRFMSDRRLEKRSDRRHDMKNSSLIAIRLCAVYEQQNQDR